jgi:hypothetical protein
MNECFEKKMGFYYQPVHPNGITQLFLKRVFLACISPFSSSGNISLNITSIINMDLIGV